MNTILGTGSRWTLGAAAMLLAGCAGVAPDAGVAQVQVLVQGRTAGVSAEVRSTPQAATSAMVDELLARPVDEAAAVRIALLNNPSVHAALATLGISEADRAQAGRVSNPHLSLGRLVEGDVREIERALKFDLLGLLALPWRARWAGQQAELARLVAAQEVIRVAADTRKAWIQAVAAAQSAAYLRDARDATEAGAELARRLARVGNWSRLAQAREQSTLAEAGAKLARAEQQAFAAREHLTRLMGLWGARTHYTLPERLPALPAQPRVLVEVEAQALRERLDVRGAVAEFGYLADALGLVRASGFVSAAELGYTRNTSYDNGAGSRAVKRGWEVELPIPLFDWGQAGTARSQALLRQAEARVREVGVRARSEAREAYHGYRSAHDLARHYQDEVVPLRKFIADEMLLRYNGMINSAFDLLADTRASIAAVQASIEAQRDFWLADTDLQTVLTGTSPGALTTMKSPAASAVASGGGH